MNVIRNFLIALTVAAWLILVAVLAIQNITPVQLNVLVLTSMNLPFGILLAVSAGAGMVFGSLIWPILLRQR